MKRPPGLIPLLSLLLLLCTLRSGAQDPEPRVTISAKNQSLREIFRTIQAQTGLNIVVSEKIISAAKKITVNVKDMPLKQALDLCLKDTDLTCSIEDGIIVVKKKEAAEVNPSVTKSSESLPDFVRGKVTNQDHQPLDGATVQVINKNITAVTSRDGEYTIMADPQDQLLFSYVNYKQQIVRVKGRSVVNITMEAQADAMAEVTISTGYQKIEQKYLTGSVTSLRMDSIKQPGLTTVDKMLEGRVPGMIYMQNSGQPGAAPKLRIRGTSTILGTREPLWVVDGIVQSDPIPVDAKNINNLDFVNLVGNAISGLNPNDIEQIDVLKDAAATALYGVRAANGVIVVTTKRGKPGPPTVTYSVNGTYTRRPRYTDKEVYMMNSLDRVDVSRELIEKQQKLYGPYEAYEKATIDYYNGNIDFDTYQQRVSKAETMNTDWFKAVTHDVFSTNHSLGISGGTQTSRYYASIGYTNEQGVIKGEYNKRYTGQIKFDVNYKNFKGQFGINVNNNQRRYVPGEIGILNYAYGTSRAIPLYNEDGSLYYYPRAQIDFAQKRTFNVLNEMDHSSATVDGTSYTAMANLNYQVIPDLQLETILSYTAANSEQLTWFDEKTNWVYSKRGANPGDDIGRDRDAIPFGGELRQQGNRQKTYNIRGQANYSHFMDAGQRHLIQANLGGEMSSAQNNGFQQGQRGYYPDRGQRFADIDPTRYFDYRQWLQRPAPNGGKMVIAQGLSNLVSAYATATYIYDDRYIVSANARSDFSNAFGDRSNEKFLPTWSLSARWNMHNDLLKNVQWINMAALRFSYGTQGNMLPYQTPYTIIEKGSINTYYSAFGSTIAYYPNPNLRWEKTDSYNGAIDFSLLNNKLNGSIGYFYKKTSNAFLTTQVAAVNGIGEYVVNGGTLENQGIELSFNFTPISHMGGKNKRGFIWRIDPQLGQVFNKLLDNALTRGNETVIGQIDNGLNSGNVTYLDFLSGAANINGKAVSTFYAYRFKGLDHNTGRPIFYGTEEENAEALFEKYSKMSAIDVLKQVMVPVGRREPVLQGGISNYFGYRNWSLNFMFTYSLGNKVRLLRIASGNYGSNRPKSQENLRQEFVNRWRYPGDEERTNVPAVNGNGTDDGTWWFKRNLNVSFGDSYYQMYDDADIRVVSGDYIKLQSASLNYNCSPELSKRLGLKAATIGLAGSNLFTLAHKELRGQDPSQSGSAPNINLSIRPVYSFNINVSL
jgi:TonB-linked SusC/RagA family outer membrane protein